MIENSFDDIRDLTMCLAGVYARKICELEEISLVGGAVAAVLPFRVYPTTNMTQVAVNIARSILSVTRAVSAMSGAACLQNFLNPGSGPFIDRQAQLNSLVMAGVLLGVNRVAASLESKVNSVFTEAVNG